MSYDHKAAERERQVAMFADAEFANGAWRWTSNGQVPFDDMLTTWIEFGYITAEQALTSQQIQQVEQAAFLASYRASQPAVPSAEEQAEMAAAFGPGETVVDVVTGRRWTT